MALGDGKVRCLSQFDQVVRVTVICRESVVIATFLSAPCARGGTRIGYPDCQLQFSTARE
jgi:hypothetical protein